MDRPNEVRHSVSRVNAATFFVALCLALSCSPASAQEATAKSSTVRPEVGKPAQAALELIKAKKGKEAQVKLAEADAIKDKTPYEAYLIQRLHAQAAAAAGDAPGAARAFEAVAAAAAAPEAERLVFLAAAASQYYTAKEYSKAAETAARYFKNGGTDKALRTMYAQALYLSNDFARAAKELAADVQAEEQAGKTPAEAQLQLLANIYLKQPDPAGYASALEKLVAHYPKKEQWLAVIHAATSRPGFADRLSLDVSRLKLATGTLRTTSEYVEAAQLALQASFPAEAKKFVDAGYAANMLGSGAEADRHKRLKDLTTKNLAEDQKTLGQEGGQSLAAGDGSAQFTAGFNLVLNGRAEKGLPMMEQALKKGGIKRIEDARLRLGYAYHLAGQTQKAVQTFKAVSGNDGTAALARLWVLRLAQSS